MSFKLNSKEYFNNYGVDVMAFSDFYPEGHQSGVTLIMNDKRLLANGDIRFEQTPGQWQPIPKRIERIVDEKENTIKTTLSFPDMERHLHGFNPMIYPDFEFSYDVVVTGMEDRVKVVVNLDREVPDEFIGKLGFNMELFPGEMVDKPYIMDDESGIFPRQPNGPTISLESNFSHSGKMEPLSNAKANMKKLSGNNTGYNPIIADDVIAKPYAVGKSLTIRPDDSLSSFTIISNGSPLKLYDGRMNHNNGWFVVNCEIEKGRTTKAIELEIIPRVEKEWIREPIIQVSQVGYHPNQPKRAIIELDKRDTALQTASLKKLTTLGYETVLEKEVSSWGEFLRYNYLSFDFSEVEESGLYQVVYKEKVSTTFKISKEVYERGVWQPVFEYFLPVQMCHMRVNEKYKVWHGRCHCDDARMAPTDYEQFDGASQGPSTMTKYKSGEHVPGLNRGGWHDAGDFDLRIESQTGEMYFLANMLEEFEAYVDSSTIDQENQVVEIHQPDGKNDILEQLEHGALSVVNAYKSLGCLYHEIMCSDLRQYVLLGDPVNMTDEIPDGENERFVFTEDNPFRQFASAADLAASGRALKGFNDELAEGCINIAAELFETTKCPEEAAEGWESRIRSLKMQAACELLISTKEDKYRQYILDNEEYIVSKGPELAWILCKAVDSINSDSFKEKLRNICIDYKKINDEAMKETPYAVPYRPGIWGAGWGILRSACYYYYVYKTFPDIMDRNFLFDSLNFVLGVHPGQNKKSFVSGVGTDSTIIGYGLNRADYSYIPGGVASGTALIRPDLPELLNFPFLWQQMEYVIGGSNCFYAFLVLAVSKILNNAK